MGGSRPFEEEMDVLLEKALKLDSGERRAFLQNRLGNNPALVEEASAMLKALEETEHFLEKPLIAYMAEATKAVSVTLDQDLGSLADYKVGALLGEGGMGKVYLAEQIHPVRRVVALKVMKIHPLDHRRASHFEREYASLAQMEHPNVARLYQAGTTASGFPFFTMELVEGVSLKAFIHQTQPSLTQRLRLFMTICDGVAHAHQKGIIHRDIKPSNVLVSGDAANPKVKLIDFGVARALALDASTTNESDSPGSTVLGTLAYMSPEQIRGEPDDVRVDVYGLGAILYELLTGEPVFEMSASGDRSSKPKFISQVLQDPPVRPSLRTGKTSRDYEPAGMGLISRVLKGDLDAIVLKALEKDREKRYPSARHLAEDVGRFLEQQPVSARSARWTYVVGLWMARHRVQAVILLVILMAIALGTSLAFWGMVQAKTAQKEAELERHQAQKSEVQLRQTLTFLEEVLAATRPGNLPPDAPISTILDVASAGADRALPHNPVIRARFQFVLGEAYMAVNQYTKAVKHYQRAYDLRVVALKHNHAHTLSAQSGIAWAQIETGDLMEARDGFKAVIENSCPSYLHYRAVVGLADVVRRLGNHRLAIETYLQALAGLPFQRETQIKNLQVALKGLGLAYAEDGQFSQARAVLETAWAEQAKNLGVGHFETLTTYTHLAELFYLTGDIAQAEVMYRVTYAWMHDILGEHHERTLNVLFNLVNCAVWQGRFAHAQSICRQLVARRSQLLGAEHRQTLLARRLMGIILGKLDQKEQALLVLRSVYQEQGEHLGQNHPDTLVTGTNLGNLLLIANQPKTAETLLRKILPIQAELLGEDHRDTLITQCTLGEALLAQDEFEAALELFIEINRKTENLPEPNDNRYVYRHFLGWTFAQLRRYEEAEPHLLQTYPELSRIDWVREHMRRFYQAWGKPQRADQYKP